MPLYRHRFTGRLAAGDQFSYQWYAFGIRDIDTAHAQAIIWNQVLWNGSVAGNGYKDHCSAGVAMNAVTTSEVNEADGKQLAQRFTDQLIAGVQANNAMPADVALCVSLRTALPQRTGRGRFYLPQPTVANLTADGRVAADIIFDTMASLAAAWAGYNTGVDRPVIYSPTFRVHRNITTFNIGDLYDTQRRRENKLAEVRSANAMP